MSCLPRWCRLSCLPKASLSSLEVFLRNSLFLSCLLRWKCSGDKARLNSGDPGLGDVWGVILAKCGDAGDPRRVSGEVLRGLWLWGWEGDTEVGEGVLARGDTGTWVDDFLLGERTARNFGISPWRVPGRRRKKTYHTYFEAFFSHKFLLWSYVVEMVPIHSQVLPKWNHRRLLRTSIISQGENTKLTLNPRTNSLRMLWFNFILGSNYLFPLF